MIIKMTNGERFTTDVSINELIGLINKGARFIEIDVANELGQVHPELINTDNIVSFVNYNLIIKNKEDVEEDPIKDPDSMEDPYLGDNNDMTYVTQAPLMPDEVKEDDRSFRLE